MYQCSRGHVVGDSGIQLIFIELSVISSHMFKGQGAEQGVGGFWWEPISKRHSTALEKVTLPVLSRATMVDCGGNHLARATHCSESRHRIKRESSGKLRGH